MKRPERYSLGARALQRALQAAALAFFAAALAGPAHAMGSVVNTAPATAQTVAQANPMPSAFDGMPCASCYLAPVPTVQGFTGEFEEPLQAAWQLLAKPSMTEEALDLPKREESVPLRVAYCCWRN